MRYNLISKIYEKIYTIRCKNVIGMGIISKVLLKICDPIIKTTVNSQNCFIHFSHQGVYYMHKYNMYDKNLNEICYYLKSQYGRSLEIVDVGANVGDTILCIGDKDNKYYAFEGEKRFYSLMKYNLQNYNYNLYKFYLGEKEKIITYGINYNDGTGSINLSKKGKKQTIKTLDSALISRNNMIDFVKIDTDGFDFAVIRGAMDILSSDKPALYFEWTAPELLKNNEMPTSIFSHLYTIGYNKGILFDKYGNIMCIFDVDNEAFLTQIINYSIYADLYFDVCLINLDSKINIDSLYNYLKGIRIKYEK